MREPEVCVDRALILLGTLQAQLGQGDTDGGDGNHPVGVVSCKRSTELTWTIETPDARC